MGTEKAEVNEKRTIKHKHTHKSPYKHTTKRTEIKEDQKANSAAGVTNGGEERTNHIQLQRY